MFCTTNFIKLDSSREYILQYETRTRISLCTIKNFPLSALFYARDAQFVRLIRLRRAKVSFWRIYHQLKFDHCIAWNRLQNLQKAYLHSFFSNTPIQASQVSAMDFSGLSIRSVDQRSTSSRSFYIWDWMVGGEDDECGGEMMEHLPNKATKEVVSPVEQHL